MNWGGTANSAGAEQPTWLFSAAACRRVSADATGSAPGPEKPTPLSPFHLLSSILYALWLPLRRLASLRLCVSALKPLRLLVATLLITGALTAFAQPSIQPILTNGPSSNRLNIVVLSEGYTAAQLGQFLADATNAVNVLLSHPPLQEYRNYFNAFAIQVASNESGSDHPAFGIYRDTVLQ